MKNCYDKNKWGILINGPCNILPCESFKFAAEWAAKYNDWIVKRLLPESREDDPIIFASVFLWDSKEHGEHDPGDVDWDNPI